MNDVEKMQIAINEALLAECEGEIPIGAAIFDENDTLIAVGHNQTITLSDPTAHAEIQAIRNAGKKLNNYRLLGTTLYITIEPCYMCAGAIIHSRISKVVFGAKDYKTGSAGTVLNILKNPIMNHKVLVEFGILEEKCSQIISDFFAKRRKEKQQIKNSMKRN